MVKKTDGSWRPCGDYRKLNKRTLPDAYPIPFVMDCTTVLHGKSVFSKVDLQRAYNQISVHPDDVPKTAIITPFGLFEFNMMTSGLCNAAQTMQRLMNSILMDFPFVYVYLDDLLIASSSEEEHLGHLEAVFKCLEEHGLSIKPEKCLFGQSSLDFLSHITKEGIRPLEAKVEAITNMPLPQTGKQLKGFIAAVNFYRRFIKGAVDSQRILNALIEGNVKNVKRPVNWSNEAEQAFIHCKQQLKNAAMLAYPAPIAQLSMQVDASDFAVGAVLNQEIDGTPQPLGYYSKALSSAQRNYSSYDRELTAIYQAIKYFKYMVEGRSFCVFTDHKPLVFAFDQNPEKANPRQLRQLDFVSQFTTDLRHIAGRDNVTADMLSRISALTTPIDFQRLAEAQKIDAELQQLLGSLQHSLRLSAIPIDGKQSLFCDISVPNTIRPFVPSQLRQAIMHQVHAQPAQW